MRAAWMALAVGLLVPGTAPAGAKVDEAMSRPALMLRQPQGAVLTCSALKKVYRDRLRNACPELRFVVLEIDRASAGQRVAARAGTHFFSSALVDSQFATLESPVGEAGVLRLDALLDLPTLQQQASAWLATKETA